MKTTELAIIIPTLNEEHYIGILLDSIIRQDLQPSEIVVVDAQSQDKTVDEIKKRQILLSQLRYYQIPKYSIAKQRNFGERQTTASRILFLDADVELKDEDTITKYIEEVSSKRPDIAVAHNYPLSKNPVDKVIFWLIRLWYEIARFIWPSAQSINMFVKRDVFERVGGFNEEIFVGEDFEFLQRTVKLGGKFAILHSPKIYTSVRRFKKEGRIRFILKVARNFLYTLGKGYKAIPKDYEFGKFKNAE